MDTNGKHPLREEPASEKSVVRVVVEVVHTKNTKIWDVKRDLNISIKARNIYGEKVVIQHQKTVDRHYFGFTVIVIVTIHTRKEQEK